MWIAVSAVNLALAVILGAFGAHGLKAHASVEQLGWWQTATDYFFYHAGLLLLGVLSKTYSQLPIKLPFLLIQTGILFFCGSLYIMALGMPRILGAITPIGGALMIAGQVCTGLECDEICKVIRNINADLSQRRAKRYSVPKPV